MSFAPMRDRRIDVWRGLCLVDVVLVHLAYNGIGFPGPLDDLIKHYTRFAAGGFVFLAGLTVATVFGPRVERSAAARRQVYDALWHRAALLVAVDMGASIAYRFLDLVRLFPVDPHTPLLEALLAIVLLQRPGLTGGILLLYSLLLAATPVLMAAQRRAGAWPIAIASAGLYGLALATHDALAWPPYAFPVLYWQPLYVAGLLCAQAYRRTLAYSPRGLLLWSAAATLGFATIFLAQYGPHFGIPHLAVALPLCFEKTPLQLGAFLWYLSIVHVMLAWTSLIWPGFLARTSVASWMAMLGRHSLLVYTAHVFTELLVMEYVWRVWPPAFIRTSLAVGDLMMLSTLCVIAESRFPGYAWAAIIRDARQVLRRWPAVAVATCTVALAVLMPHPIGGPDHDDIIVFSIEPDPGAEEPVLEVSIDAPIEQNPLQLPQSSDFEPLPSPNVFEEPLESPA